MVFEECLGLTKEACMDLIRDDVEENPDIFEGRSFDDFEIHEGHVRTADQSNYYKVGLRTNTAETGVGGVLGDGMIWYPFEWCLTEEDCYTIGPWDCDVGTPLSVEECCNMIKAAEPHPDKNGNYLECFESFPVGSIDNPINYSRIMIHTDENGLVVHAPRNE